MLPEYTRCLLVSGMFNTQAVWLDKAHASCLPLPTKSKHAMRKWTVSFVYYTKDTNYTSIQCWNKDELRHRNAVLLENVIWLIATGVGHKDILSFNSIGILYSCGSRPSTKLHGKKKYNWLDFITNNIDWILMIDQYQRKFQPFGIKSTWFLCRP